MNEKSIDSLLQENRVINPPKSFSDQAHVKNLDEYRRLYSRSIEAPEEFWKDIALGFEWQKEFDQVLDYSFDKDLSIKWFLNGKTNICYNALDRHLQTQGDKTAFVYVPNEGETQRITYKELHSQVCAFANGLKKLGLQKGERVAIYMPMIPEAAVAMLACARLGLVHNVVFGGFSSQSLKDRIIDSGAKTLITANQLLRGSKVLDLKNIADEAIDLCSSEGHVVAKSIVFLRTEAECEMIEDRDVFWHEVVAGAGSDSACEWMDSEDPLFMLYTSGSTGKPKGVLHTTAGYMVYTATTFKYLFDYQKDDVFFCTADVGWITGHSYLVYGPLLNGATCVLFEGIPNHPAPDRFWDIVEKEKVSILYTAPTAIRALMREGDSWPNKHDLSSLRLLGTVGEPINPEAWIWYHKVIGKENCPIVDTYWQTETGGVLISAFPGAVPLKPGSATVPFFGVKPKVIREDGSECDANEGGYLVMEKPWPGMMRTVYGDHQRFFDTYFSRFSGYYFTGDSARKDSDGYLWVLGRVDDVVNVSGHRLGTAEIESALVAHQNVSEAAVVGFPHEIKGQGIYAYVSLKEGVAEQAELEKELRDFVGKEIGAIAKPDVIHFSNALPKTRSGKIMRRILRKIAAGDTENLGDTTTLADPAVVETLTQTRKKLVSG
ncbi:MAG: acetate--CoA ligase [Deltaproteobacteria bacterium]|nr:acetate--CoA ligase [Deltaproteobacteria bacterium]